MRRKDQSCPCLETLSEISKQVAELRSLLLKFTNAHAQPPALLLARLNGTEQAILDTLGSNEWTGKKIAKEVGCHHSSTFRATLSGLVKRGLLEKGRTGYFNPQKRAS